MFAGFGVALEPANKLVDELLLEPFGSLTSPALFECLRLFPRNKQRFQRLFEFLKALVLGTADQANGWR